MLEYARTVQHVSDNTVRSVDVLLIEDNRGDIRMTQEGLRRSIAGCKLTSIEDPDHALAQLRGDKMPTLKPRVIFLDLNLPKMSGLEIIATIRKTPGLEYVPIVILSAAENPEEVRRAYIRGANCFIRKPANLDEFMHRVSRCCEFWCDIVVLPPC